MQAEIVSGETEEPSRAAQLRPTSGRTRIIALYQSNWKVCEIAEDPDVIASSEMQDRTHLLSRCRKIYDILKELRATGQLHAGTAGLPPNQTDPTVTLTQKGAVTSPRVPPPAAPDVPDATPSPGVPVTDKKIGTTNWRELGRSADRMIELRGKAGWSQDYARWELPNATRPIGVIAIGDLQVGSYGTTHQLVEKLTDDLLSVPDLYVMLVGDLLQLAIKMRGVAEVNDNVLTPGLQHDYLEGWLEEIKERVICATWCNHGVMREEDQAGASLVKRILSRSVIYHDGIGHVDLRVGQQVYTAAVTHRFQARSKFNPLHGQQCYIREQAHDREIAVAGDSHVPGLLKYTSGGRVRLALNCGSTQLDSGYAKRFFALKTFDTFPMFTLDPVDHLFTPYWSVQEWLRVRDSKE